MYLSSCFVHAQAQGTAHLGRYRRAWRRGLGAGPLPLRVLGAVLLLHLERSQVDRKGGSCLTAATTSGRICNKW